MAKNFKQDVLKEYDPINDIRVRVVSDIRPKVLDIRVFVSATNFTGFTKKGLRFDVKEDIQALRDRLTEVIREWDSL